MITDSGAMDTHIGSHTYTNINSSEPLVDMPIPLLHDTLQNLRWDYKDISVINSWSLYQLSYYSLILFSFKYYVSTNIRPNTLWMYHMGYRIREQEKEQNRYKDNWYND